MDFFIRSMPSTRTVLKNLAQLNSILVAICLLPIIVAPPLYFYVDAMPPHLRPSFEFLSLGTIYYVYIALLSITSLLTFLLIGSDKILDPNEDNGPTIRTAIAVAIVITYFAIMVSLFNAPRVTDQSIEVFKSLGALVTSIMAFYFGSTTINNVSALMTEASRKSQTKQASIEPADKEQ